jgi:hypothetical protein
VPLAEGQHYAETIGRCWIDGGARTTTMIAECAVGRLITATPYGPAERCPADAIVGVDVVGWPTALQLCQGHDEMLRIYPLDVGLG